MQLTPVNPEAYAKHTTFAKRTTHAPDFPKKGGHYCLFILLSRELDVIPDLVMSGALQHIDHLHVDWTR